MRRPTSSLTLATVLATSLAIALAQGCAPSGAVPSAAGATEDDDVAGGAGGGDATGSTTSSTTTDPGGFGGAGTAGTCGDLPADLRGAGVADADVALFDAKPGAAAPFVFDPPSGAVLPAGWPSPSFLVHTTTLPRLARVVMTAGERRVAFVAAPEEAPRSHADAVVTGAWWTIALPASAWSAVRCAAGGSIAWSIDWAEVGAASPSGVASGSLALLETVTKPDMSYWEIGQASGNGKQEDDFAIRRLAVESGVPQTLVGAHDGCIGCHTSSPDGMDIAYQRGGGLGWKVEIARPVAGAQAVASPVVTPAAKALLDATLLMVPTTSPGAWSDATGRWLGAVTSTAGEPGRLALVQVDAEKPAVALGPASASLDGDAAVAVASPALSPDATRVVYAATPNMVDGYFAPSGFGGDSMRSDLWQVPVTLAKGQAPVFGAPTPVPFASGTEENETYPTFSRDGKLLAFMRSAKGRGGYDEVTGEIWVMPADGSRPPVRLAANDAPKDGSVYAGPGLTSSWPRFGESSVTTAEGTWYLVLFSSRRGSAELWRDDGGGSSPIDGRPIGRLYLATVLVANDGSITTFPAALVPGQRVDAGAHTATFTTVTSVPPPAPK